MLSGNSSTPVAIGRKALLAGRLDEARSCFEVALREAPGDVAALDGMGLIALHAGENDLASELFDLCVRLDDGFVVARSHLGTAHYRAGRSDVALGHFLEVLGRDVQDPDHWANAGNAFRATGQPVEALQAYESALTIAPADARLLLNRGNALVDLKRFDEAYHAFAEAWSIDPALEEAQFNLGLLALRCGDFRRGWALHEHRQTHAAKRKSSRPLANVPFWDGLQPLEGRRVVLFSEQGLGDVIQFLRFVPQIVSRKAQVDLWVAPALVRLVSASFPECRVYADVPPDLAADFCCPLMSLAERLSVDLPKLPAANFPYLHAGSINVERGDEKGLRIGLMWRGSDNPRLQNRSISLALLEPLMLQDATYFCLDKHVHADDLEFVTRRNIHVPKPGGDLADTAALIATLDLVITIDTSIAHLAGALGVPTWVLLPYVADWRWLEGRDDSPWYPSMKLFRQPIAGDWGALIDSIANG